MSSNPLYANAHFRNALPQPAPSTLTFHFRLCPFVDGCNHPFTIGGGVIILMQPSRVGYSSGGSIVFSSPLMSWNEVSPPVGERRGSNDWRQFTVMKWADKERNNKKERKGEVIKRKKRERSLKDEREREKEREREISAHFVGIIHIHVKGFPHQRNSLCQTYWLIIRTKSKRIRVVPKECICGCHQAVGGSRENI